MAVETSDWARISTVAGGLEGLELLILFGSRATGASHALSDWDFAAMAVEPTVHDRLAAALSMALKCDAVDVVDLQRAGGLVRYRAARDGRLIFEARPHLYEKFVVAAVGFWADVGPLIEREYRAVLAGIQP